MAERAASPHPWAMATEPSVQVLCLLNETAAPVLQKHPHCSCLQQHRGHSPDWERLGAATAHGWRAQDTLFFPKDTSTCWLHTKRVNAASAGWPLPNRHTSLPSMSQTHPLKPAAPSLGKHLPAWLQHAPTQAHQHWCSCVHLFSFCRPLIFFFNCSDRKLISLRGIHPLHCYLHIFFHVRLTQQSVYYSLAVYDVLLPEWLCL